MKKSLLLILTLLIHLISCRSAQMDLPETSHFQEAAWAAVKPLNLPANANLNLQPRGNKVIARFTDAMQQNPYAQVTLDRQTRQVVSVNDLRRK
jgi:hypothetical protein